MPQNIEQQYTVSELAGMIKVSNSKALNMVKNEPGVLRILPPLRKGVRPKAMYRIPESVVQRILRRFANPPVSKEIGTAGSAPSRVA